MAYIDPDGMFGGDRMAILSDSAKMAWPWFWCASNTVGRVELNYRKFLRTAFRQFRKPPAETQFWEWVAEFHEAHLLFAYEVNGKAWGQWYVSEKYLPTYKLKSDLKTPAPDAKVFAAWQDTYKNISVSSLIGKCRVLNVSANLSESLRISEGISILVGEIEERLRRGEDINLCAADAAPDPVAAAEPVPAKRRPMKAWFDTQHERFYAAYWRKVGKADSRKAFERRVCLLVEQGKGFDEAADFLVLMATSDRERFDGTEDWTWRVNLHPSTWLNQERWNDEARPKKPTLTTRLENL